MPVRMKCPDGFNRDPKDGLCKDPDGNVYQEKNDNQQSQNDKPLVDEVQRVENHKQRVQTIKERKQKAMDFQKSLKTFVAKVKNNEFKKMMESMGLGGLYGMFVIPISAMGSITNVIARQFYDYYDIKEQKDKANNYDEGYALGLSRIMDSFKMDNFTSGEQVKDFYKAMDSHLEELYNSKAVQRKDKTSKEYGELMAYYMVLHQTKDKINQWNEQGQKKFGKEFKRCDYADELDMVSMLENLSKVAGRNKKRGLIGNKKKSDKESIAQFDKVRQRNK